MPALDRRLLRHLAAEVDAQHRDQLSPIADLVDAGVRARTTRRGALKGVGAVLLGTGAATLGGASLLAGAAAAAESGPTTTAAAATGGEDAPPRRPTAADLGLLQFAESVEFAAVAAYDAAIATGLLSDGVAAVAQLFRNHHLDHADAHAGLLGTARVGSANAALLAEFAPLIGRARTEAALLEIALTLENAAEATYATALGAFEGTQAAEVAASIMPIEGRHAVVLAAALGLDVDEQIPVAIVSARAGLNPADYALEA